jgi:tripeptide aminopeptidase
MRAYERFLNYVKIDTTSDENAPESLCPSTPGQKELASMLVKEMLNLGIKDARMDEYGYVYGTLEANCDARDIPVIGLIVHMDTSNAAPGKNIKSQIIEKYDGGDIVLNPGKNIVMKVSEYDSLLSHVGEDLIVTDGTTLLGADNKAGIAEILTAVEALREGKIKHGIIKIAFTPDEEIGRGADRFDVKGFGADFAYTVDGGALGEIEYENFNAASADVTINGVSIHPGDAKNKMKNAALIAMEFNSLLPANEIPAATEGYEGFHHLTRMAGTEEKSELHYIIRDHDRNKFERKKDLFIKAAQFINFKYGEGTLELNLKDSYYNMKEKIEPHMFLIKNAQKAMREAGVELKIVPIRGGTDGARLSFMGLPCPNLSTGGHNFHGRFEYISIQAMDKMVEVLVNLVKMQNV